MNSTATLNKSDRTWILMAHRSGAKIFSSMGYGHDLRQLKNFDFPEGRLRDQEIDTDDKGRRNSSVAGRRNSGGGLDKHEGAATHIARVFVHELVEHLRKGRVNHLYERLILVAEPRFLGVLRSQLDKETAKKVTGSFHHNYIDLPVNDLSDYLRNVVSGRSEAA
jgi:protein required for attachment to host cells